MFGKITIDIANGQPKLNGVINNLTPRGMIEIVETLFSYLDIPDVESYKTLCGIYKQLPKEAAPVSVESKTEKDPDPTIIEEIEKTTDADVSMPKLTPKDTAELRASDLKVLHYLISKADDNGFVILDSNTLVNVTELSRSSISYALIRLEDRGVIRRLTKGKQINGIRLLKSL